MSVHDDELTITADIVRALVAAQFPQWRDRPVRKVDAGGTVNAIFRIGDDLAARLPLRPADPAATRTQLRREAAAAALLAALLSPAPHPAEPSGPAPLSPAPHPAEPSGPAPHPAAPHRAEPRPAASHSAGPHAPAPMSCRAPVPVALGEPGPGYPLPWSVQTWLPGTTADAHGSEALARDLAALVRTLRAVDTGGRRFDGDNRGGDLRAHDGWMQTCLARSEPLLDVPPLRALWHELRDLPREAPDVMTHGDLIPANVLVRDGRLAGVLDGGGFGPADPALDVIAGWHLLDDGPRAVFRADLGCDDLEWQRSRAWAFEQALGLVWYYADTHPTMSALGRRTLARVVAG